MFDDYVVLILAFVVFVLYFYSNSSENFKEQTGGRNSRRGRGTRHRRIESNIWNNFTRRGRHGRRDYYGFYGNYWNVYNPWRINNPCATYAAEKCKGNYYYEPCYETRYLNCMNNTYYA